MHVFIRRLKRADARALHRFECDNRLFFEKLVPSRGDDYYHYETFFERHESLLLEQKNDRSHFYLIRNKSGQIIGRINLVDIDYTAKYGHIGFRVGANFTGQGVAFQALKSLLEKETDIQKIYGKTTTSNIASQKVMKM